ncbi:MAG: SemiSWEET transporter [Thermoplasmata archaeon]
MDYINIMGLIAGTLTTISYLPQAIKIWKKKSAKEVSLLMYIIISIGILLWLIYGIEIHSLPLILANGISLIFSLIILTGKLKYK